jgi:hypothetical protein
MLRNDNARIVPLDGTWDFRLGTGAAWSAIGVPGCWEAQGYSKWVDGPAEYRRAFMLPDEWVGSRIILEFDAVSYACTVRVNWQEVGVHRGIWTPFAFDITAHVTFGGENLLSILLYKPGTQYPVRATLAGFLPDVATTFGGIWQSVRLRAVEHAIEDLRLRADGARGILHVSGRAVATRALPRATVAVRLTRAGEPEVAAACQADAAGSFELALAVPNPMLWSPADPALYDVAVEVMGDDRPLAAACERIGFRALAAEGDRLQLNGAPICVRGVLHWGPARPWIFGEFNDSDGFRDIAAITAANDGTKPWWLTADNPVHTWRPEVRALLEEDELLGRAQLPFGPQDLIEISRRQSLAVMKFVLEAVRRRAGMGGYVVIGIRDTPIVTSGILDDFGRTKWPAADFVRFNDDVVLCLETDRRRSRHAGGDHPERSDLHSWWSGSEASFQIVLNNAGSVLHPDAELQWQYTEPGGAVVAAGRVALPTADVRGAPYRIATIAFHLPKVQVGTTLHLRVWLTDPTRSIKNEWPLWVFPHPPVWPAQMALYDPSFTLADWDEPQLSCQGEWRKQDWQAAKLVIATAIDEPLIQYVTHGGAVLLLQQQEGPLPVRRLPFWRESIKLLYPHPVWQRFPHERYADLQFFGMATEFALDTEQLSAYLPGITKTRPILRRLDAREFHVSDHLIELEIGTGRLLVSTLRHQGGAGAQPTGLERNVAGYFLLDAMVAYLLRSSDSKDKEPQA